MQLVIKTPGPHVPQNVEADLSPDGPPHRFESTNVGAELG
jgi:hypothetical protein